MQTIKSLISLHTKIQKLIPKKPQANSFVQLDHKVSFSFGRQIAKKKSAFTQQQEIQDDQDNEIEDDYQSYTPKKVSLMKGSQNQTNLHTTEQIMEQYDRYGQDGVENQDMIMRATSMQEFFQIYRERKASFNIVNYSTLYHRIIKLQLDQTNLKQSEFEEMQKNRKKYLKKKQTELIKNSEFFEIIQYMAENISEMNSFALSNFISNLAKIDYFDEKILRNVVSLKQNYDQFNLTAISYSLWALSKYNIKDEEFLKFSENYIINYGKYINENSLCNLFFTLSKLESTNVQVKIKLETKIVEQAQKLDSTQILLIFSVYNKQKGSMNLHVLDACTTRFITLIKEHSMRNISNLVTYCSNLDYANHNLFNTIESELLRRLSPLLQEGEHTQQVDGQQDDQFQNEQNEQNQEQQDLVPQSDLNLNENAEVILQQFMQNNEIKEGQEMQQNEIRQSIFKEAKSQEDSQTEQQSQTKYDQQIQKEEQYKPLKGQYLELNPTQEIQNQKKKKNQQLSLSNPTELDKQIYSLSPHDAAEILVGFCRLKVIKTNLFELLEYNFIKKIDQASAQSIVSYAYAHSSLCMQMLMGFQDNKKAFTRKSLKNLKKYNHSFYEIVVKKAQQKIEEFSVEQLTLFFQSAARPLVKKKAICRELVQLGVSGVPKLNNLGSQMALPDIQKKQYEYYRSLMNFSFQNLQTDKIMEAYKQENIDVEKLMKTYGYIAPKAQTSSLPKFSVEDLDFDEEEEDNFETANSKEDQQKGDQQSEKDKSSNL